MVNNKKKYVGSFPNEIQAARAYDIAAIQNHGPKAKTNFKYEINDIIKIKNSPSILTKIKR